MKVNATASGKRRSGRTSLYVVQDKAQAVDLREETTAKLDREHQTAEFRSLIKSLGVEVFYADGNWKPAKAAADDRKIILPKGNAIKTEDGKVFYRLMGKTKELQFYGTAQLPTKPDK